MRLAIIALLLFNTLPFFAQLPDTEIWLVEWKDSFGISVLGNAMNITQRPGYDNQPSFSPDGRHIFYTSVRDTQSDIYRYEIKTKKTSRITKTRESEYSPTVMPGGKSISVVRVELDSTQRLWKFPVSGKPEFALIMDKVKRVGYHSWLGPDSLALFLLTDPFSLQTVHVKKQELNLIANNPGRAFVGLPTSDLVFLEKQNSVSIPDTIYVFDPFRKIVYKKFEALPGSEDFALATFIDSKGYASNALLMCSGSKVYMQWTEDKKTSWLPVGDLSRFGIQNITRIAISPDKKWIAVVSNPPK